MKTVDEAKLKSFGRPAGMPFKITKIGHVVLNVTDLERSVKFYTEVLGFKVSDVYPHNMMPGGMVFLRFNPDHHGIALVGGLDAQKVNSDLHHMAFEVDTLDEVIRARNHLRAHNARIDFEGRRRAGVQIAVEFRDPDGHRLEIYWGLDRVGSDDKIRPAAEWKGAPSLRAAIEDPVVGQDTSLKDPSLLDTLNR
jgi:catechol 2,3-dioxygenase-like lactoylglutathione lyase family enzyme